MTRVVLCVREDTRIDTVRSLLLEHGISGVPVVDEIGAPVGVVSKTDLVRLEPFGFATADAGETDDSPERRFRVHTDEGFEYELGVGFHAEHLPPATAWELMMPLAFTLPLDAPATQAAALMAFEGVHRILIVGRDRAVAGILSALDLARTVAQKAGFLGSNTERLGPVPPPSGDNPRLRFGGER